MIKSLFRRLVYAGSSRLRSYETLVISCLKTRMNPDTARILDEQVKSICLVQRWSQDKMVIVSFGEAKPSLPKFSNVAPELRAGRVILRSQDDAASLTCDVVIHRGVLSSLEFSRTPSRRTLQPLSCAEARIIARLDAPIHEARIVSSDEITSGPFATLRRRYTISRVIAPASAAEIEAFEEIVEGYIPGDFKQLIKQSNGFLIDGWEFYGTRSRSVNLPEGLYHLVAEDAGGTFAVCLRQGNSASEVLLYDELNDELVSAGQSFVQALLSALSRDSQ